jgi:hypothetical protein
MVWSCDDGTPFPNLGKQQATELDPDDLCTEEGVTIQSWKNL